MTSSNSEIKYNKGNFLCLQGDSAESFFILKKGRVSILYNIDTKRPSEIEVLSNGRKVTEISEIGGVFGEAGIFIGHRTASIKVEQNGTIIDHVKLPEGGIEALVLNNPKTGLTLCRSLAGRLRSLSEQIRNATFATMNIHSTYNSLCLALLRIVNSLESSSSYDMVKGLVEKIRQSKMFISGEELQRERSSTMTVFNQALARKRAGKMNLDKGTELCREGDIGRALYFVLEGELEVRIAGQVVATIEKGELVGEIAVLLKEHPKRTASIKAVENSTLASISALDFGNTVMEHPNILNSLASILSRRIESTNHMIVDMETAISTELENLSSAPESCEAVFLRLASSLPPSFSKEIDLCKGHAQRALKASKNMSGTYQEIIKRINETH